MRAARFPTVGAFASRLGEAEFIASGQIERPVRRLRNAYAEREALLTTHLRSLDSSNHSTAANGTEVPLVSDYGNARGLILGYGLTMRKRFAKECPWSRGDPSRANSLTAFECSGC